MQEHPLETQLGHGLVEFGVPVLLISPHRVTSVRGVHADLMRPAGKEAHLHESRALTEELHGPELAQGRLAGSVDPYGALAAHAGIRAQRRIDSFLAQIPLALQESEVALLERG